MKLVRHAKHLAAMAAFAGISLSSAYAALPSYLPPTLSPLDTTALTSVSPLLNNFNNYLSAINDQLAVGQSLALPNGTLPTDFEYFDAVADAVVAAPENAEGIVSAAVQYKPGKVKDIVKAVVAKTVTAAPDAVAGAAHAAPAKAGDAAAGAIMALIANSAGTSAAALADAADDAVVDETRELIEKVAKSAVAATKLSTTQNASATAVANAILDAYLVDVAPTHGDAFIDDVARGAIAGVTGFASTAKKDVAAAMLGRMAFQSTDTKPAGYVDGDLKPGVTKAMIVNLAMGALKSSLFVAGTSSYDSVATSLDTAAKALITNNAALTGIDNAIAAGSKIQRFLRSNPANDPVVSFSAQLTGTEAPYVDSFVSGAVQAVKGKAADFAKAAFEDANVGTLSLAQKQGIVAAAITGNVGATAKVVTNVITTTSSNKMTAAEAVTAAIPAANDLYSGLATLAAMKTIAVDANEIANSKATLSAAITAANNAGYQSAFADIALNAAKAKKLIDNDLIVEAVNDVPNGWEEAVAAAIVANNPKDKDAVPDVVGDTASQNSGKNYQEAVNAAAAKSGANAASVQVAVDIAIAGKASPKTLFDDAIEKAYANPDKARAVLFGVGAVNAKLAIPTMAMLLRLKGAGSDVDSAILDYTKSLNKKTKLNVQVAYDTAEDALAHPENIFDLVDHKVLTNPKQAVDIISAVVAVRPEYAHYAARAAAYRSPALAGKTAAAAIQFAHMRSNRDVIGVDSQNGNQDDPAAVAAISAAVVLGIQDAKLATPAKQEAAIKAAIGGMVKASLAFQNPLITGTTEPDLSDKKAGLVGKDATFKEATGNGTDINDSNNYVLRRTKGTAAVLTGAVSELQSDDVSTTLVNELTGLNPLAKIAITAAAKAAKAHSLAFAQAAGSACAAAAAAGNVTFMGFADIVAAFAGLGQDDAKLLAAAQFGAAQFAASEYGAGAAGIRNYEHVSGHGLPVTDLSNF